MSRMVRWPRKKPSQNNKRRSRRSRSRGLIDRDVSAVTPAGAGDVDSRLIGGGATALRRLIDFADAREPAACRWNVWLLQTVHRINKQKLARTAYTTGA